MRRAKVITLTRTEANIMLASGTLPRGHATLHELLDSTKTVYHIEGTPPHDFRIHRNLP